MPRLRVKEKRTADEGCSYILGVDRVASNLVRKLLRYEMLHKILDLVDQSGSG
jgi:hypothetical protein